MILPGVRVNLFVVLGVEVREVGLTIVEDRKIQRRPSVDGLLEDRSVVEYDAPIVYVDCGARGRSGRLLHADGCRRRLLHDDGRRGRGLRYHYEQLLDTACLLLREARVDVLGVGLVPQQNDLVFEESLSLRR